MELDPKYVWAPCHVMCTVILIGWDPTTAHPPAIGLVYEGAIGQPRIDDISFTVTPACLETVGYKEMAFIFADQ